MPSRRRVRRVKHHLKCTIRERNRIVDTYITTESYYQTAKKLGLAYSQVRYWVFKYVDPNFHSKELGGDKKSVFLLVDLLLF